MDFKVGGTHKGITAIQMDLKVAWPDPRRLSRKRWRRPVKARLVYSGRDHAQRPSRKPREELPYAPKMLSTKIDVDKIREVIGKGGSVIQKIQAECNCKIDIEETAACLISALNTKDAKRACGGGDHHGRIRKSLHLQGQGYPPDDLRRVCGDCAGAEACAHQPPRRPSAWRRSRMSYRW